jgi:hypothetical protein
VAFSGGENTRRAMTTIFLLVETKANKVLDPFFARA